MDLIFASSPTTTPSPVEYASLLEEGLSVPYKNSYGIASVLARDLALALFFILGNYRGRPAFPKALFHCDFEDGWCPKFKQSKTSDIPWNLWSGRTPSNKTGPDFDHTRFNKEGTYLYLEASNVRYGDTAVFTTPPVMMVDKPYYCLRFWYNMYGTGTGSLWVRWNAIGEGGQHAIVEKFAGSLSRRPGHWRESLTTLRSTSRIMFFRPVVFEFRGIRGFSYTSDIAVDDIVLLPGKCDDQTIFSSAATTAIFRMITTTEPPSTTTTPSWKATHPDFAKCGEHSYHHTTKQRCCNGVVRNVKSHHQRCCATKLFNVIHMQCCGGNPIWVNTQGCCFGRIIYPKKKRGCCANKGTYDLIKERCVNGKVKKRKTALRRRGRRSVGLK